MEKAKTDATRTSNLDEAIRIRDALDELKRQETSSARSKESEGNAALRTKLTGTTWGLPGSAKISFLADGSVARTDTFVGRWAPTDAQTVVVRYTNDAIDSFTFDEKFSRYTALGHAVSNKFEGAKLP